MEKSRLEPADPSDVYRSGASNNRSQPEAVTQNCILLYRAVSQVFNLQGARTVAADLIALNRTIWSVQNFWDLKAGARSAGWKPAMQRTCATLIFGPQKEPV